MKFFLALCTCLLCLGFVATPAVGATIYRYDDGVAETALGYSDLWWGNAFSVAGNDRLITSVDVAFGYVDAQGTVWTGGLGAGNPFSVSLFDGDPTAGLTLLQTVDAQVTGTDGTTFQTVDLTDTVVGDRFFVALHMAANGSAASIDLDSTGQSWFAAGTGPDGTPGHLLPLSAITGSSGAFMIRANALDSTLNNQPPGPTDAPMPEPATMSALLLAAAGLSGYIRRRRN